MKKFLAGLTTFMMVGCMEQQAPHEVTDIPSDMFEITTVSDQLSKPWGVAVLPDGSYLVTEISGQIKRIGADGVTEVTGGPDQIYVDGQGGLLGISLSPDFDHTGFVYFAYSYGDKSDNGTAVYKARLDGDALKDGETIFKTDPGRSTSAHFGGRLTFLPDGSLVVALGDGFAYREAAQDKSSHLGKTVRMTMEGAAPEDNPFKNNELANPYVYTLGHRNIQGLAYDPVEDRLWAHEHGPRGGDELNIIKPGANYGWPLATTGVDYNGARITPYKQKAETEPYIYEWTPSIAPSGLALYRGEMFSEWNGDALVGALAGQSLWRIDLEAGRATSAQRLLRDLNYRIRDVVVDQDGSILLAAETPDGGRLLRVRKKSP